MLPAVPRRAWPRGPPPGSGPGAGDPGHPPRPRAAPDHRSHRGRATAPRRTRRARRGPNPAPAIRRPSVARPTPAGEGPTAVRPAGTGGGTRRGGSRRRPPPIPRPGAGTRAPIPPSDRPSAPTRAPGDTRRRCSPPAALRRTARAGSGTAIRRNRSTGPQMNGPRSEGRSLERCSRPRPRCAGSRSPRARPVRRRSRS